MNEPTLEDGEDLYNPTAVMTQDPVIACVSKKQKEEIQRLSKDKGPNFMIPAMVFIGLYVYLRFLR